MYRDCELCGEEFDDASQQKKSIGGKINHCVDCSEETAVKYLGVQNASGKMSGCEILAFKNNEDRDNFNASWRNNSGMNKGKSCQIGRHISASSASFSFVKIAEFGRSDNHKGKM